LDQGLSKYAIYSACIDEQNNLYSVLEKRQYKNSIVFIGKSLDELLNHIQQNYYYEVGAPDLTPTYC